MHHTSFTDSTVSFPMKKVRGTRAGRGSYGELPEMMASSSRKFLQGETSGRHRDKYLDGTNEGERRPQGPYKRPSKQLLNGISALGSPRQECIKSSLLFPLRLSLLSFLVIQFFICAREQTWQLPRQWRTPLLCPATETLFLIAV